MLAALQRAASIRGLTLIGSKNVEERLALGDELLELARQSRDPRLELDALVVRSATHLEIADLVDLEADIGRFEALAERLHWWAPRFFTLQLRGTLACMRGAFDQARAVAEEMLETGAHDTNAVNAYAAQLFTLAREEGSLGELLPAVEESVRANPSLIAFRAALAAARAELGDHEGAREHVDVLAVDDFAAIYPGQTWVISLALLTEACALLGDGDRAAALGQRLASRSGRLVFASGGLACIGPVDRYVAIAAAAAGRFHDAEPAFEAALALERRLDLPPAEARTRLWYARQLAARGDTEGSREMATASHDLAARLGMAGVAAAASQLCSPREP